MIVLSAMEMSCSVLMLFPTIMVNTASSSSLLILSSPSRSYILKAKWSFSILVLSLFFSALFLIGLKWAKTRAKSLKSTLSSSPFLLSKKKA